MRIIDAHLHLGINPNTKQYTVDDLSRELVDAGASGAVCFAFPEDMYRSVDDAEIRRRMNEYVRDADGLARDLTIYPFYFMAMDYLLPADLDAYVGIKWHRHSDEPRYNYDDPACKEALREIERRALPMTLEEEFHCTEHVAQTYPGIPLIIPHLGRLNGGPDRMDRFFDRQNIYFDTGPAGAEETILRFVEQIGPKRLVMGSDYSGCVPPFTHTPKLERAKIEGLGLSESEERLILGENIERLLAANGSPQVNVD